MLPPTTTTLTAPTLLLLLLLSPLTHTQTTTPAPAPAHPRASALSAFEAASLSTVSSLRSSLLANPTYSSLSAFLATQTLIPPASLAREEAAYLRAVATGATDADVPFITDLPSQYRGYAEGMVSAVVAAEEGERSAEVSLRREVATMVKAKGKDAGSGYGSGYAYGSGVVTGTGGVGAAAAAAAAATGTGAPGAGGGSAANATMTGVTTGMTKAPATSPPASQPSGSGALGIREVGVGAWCAGMLGMGVGVMMLM